MGARLCSSKNAVTVLEPSRTHSTPPPCAPSGNRVAPEPVPMDGSGSTATSMSPRSRSATAIQAVARGFLTREQAKDSRRRRSQEPRQSTASGASAGDDDGGGGGDMLANLFAGSDDEDWEDQWEPVPDDGGAGEDEGKEGGNAEEEPNPAVKTPPPAAEPELFTKDCVHTCFLRFTVKCCVCSDTRSAVSASVGYVDGVGLTADAYKRTHGYCVVCVTRYESDPNNNQTPPLSPPGTVPQAVTT